MSLRNLLPKKKYGLSDQVRISHKSKGGGRCKEGTVVKILAFFAYVRDRNGTTYAVSHCTLLDAGHRDKWRILQTWLEPAFQQVFAHSVGIPLASPFIIYNIKNNRQ